METLGKPEPFVYGEFLEPDCLTERSENNHVISLHNPASAKDKEKFPTDFTQQERHSIHCPIGGIYRLSGCRWIFPKTAASNANQYASTGKMPVLFAEEPTGGSAQLSGGNL